MNRTLPMILCAMILLCACSALPAEDCLTTAESIQFPDDTTSPQLEGMKANRQEKTEVTACPEEQTLPTVTELTQPNVPSETVHGTTAPTVQEEVPAETIHQASDPTTSETQAMTNPSETEPTSHQHEYYQEVIRPTCTTGGYVLHTCFCGDHFISDETQATGHAYTQEIVAPTMWKQGFTTFTCTRCADSYTDCYINISAEEKATFIQAVSEATLKYINQFRSEPAQSLPKLSEVASYRAAQLHSNFAHSTKALREALAHYQYGEYKQPVGWDPSEYYYDFSGREAITRSSVIGTADEIGKRLARNFLDSSGHWTYVGNSEYSYIAVGVSYDPAKLYRWTCCVFVSDTGDYG